MQQDGCDRVEHTKRTRNDCIVAVNQEHFVMVQLSLITVINTSSSIYFPNLCGLQPISVLYFVGLEQVLTTLRSFCYLLCHRSVVARRIILLSTVIGMEVPFMISEEI